MIADEGKAVSKIDSKLLAQVHSLLREYATQSCSSADEQVDQIDNKKKCLARTEELISSARQSCSHSWSALRSDWPII